VTPDLKLWQTYLLPWRGVLFIRESLMPSTITHLEVTAQHSQSGLNPSRDVEPRRTACSRSTTRRARPTCPSKIAAAAVGMPWNLHLSPDLCLEVKAPEKTRKPEIR